VNKVRLSRPRKFQPSTRRDQIRKKAESALSPEESPVKFRLRFRKPAKTVQEENNPSASLQAQQQEEEVGSGEPLLTDIRTQTTTEFFPIRENKFIEKEPEITTTRQTFTIRTTPEPISTTSNVQDILTVTNNAFLENEVIPEGTERFPTQQQIEVSSLPTTTRTRFVRPRKFNFSRKRVNNRNQRPTETSTTSTTTTERPTSPPITASIIPVTNPSVEVGEIPFAVINIQENEVRPVNKFESFASRDSFPVKNRNGLEALRRLQQIATNAKSKDIQPAFIQQTLSRQQTRRKPQFNLKTELETSESDKVMLVPTQVKPVSKNIKPAFSLIKPTNRPVSFPRNQIKIVPELPRSVLQKEVVRKPQLTLGFNPEPNKQKPNFLEQKTFEREPLPTSRLPLITLKQEEIISRKPLVKENIKPQPLPRIIQQQSKQIIPISRIEQPVQRQRQQQPQQTIPIQKIEQTVRQNSLQSSLPVKSKSPPTFQPFKLPDFFNVPFSNPLLDQGNKVADDNAGLFNTVGQPVGQFGVVQGHPQAHNLNINTGSYSFVVGL